MSLASQAFRELSLLPRVLQDMVTSYLAPELMESCELPSLVIGMIVHDDEVYHLCDVGRVLHTGWNYEFRYKQRTRGPWRINLMGDGTIFMYHNARPFLCTRLTQPFRVLQMGYVPCTNRILVSNSCTLMSYVVCDFNTLGEPLHRPCTVQHWTAWDVWMDEYVVCYKHGVLSILDSTFRLLDCIEVPGKCARFCQAYVLCHGDRIFLTVGKQHHVWGFLPLTSRESQ
jgi:hypothetical protein